MQSDLAGTLDTIAQEGPRGFYRGAVAEKIVRAVQAAGGNMTTEDLAQYEAVERKPVSGTYHEYDIFSMPPPSSGGVHLVQILNILDGFDLAPLGPTSGQAAHIRVEAMKLAYADRAEYLGDPDYTKVPVERIDLEGICGAAQDADRPGKSAGLERHQARQPGPVRERPHNALFDRR